MLSPPRSRSAPRAQPDEPLDVHAANALLACSAECLAGGAAEVEMPLPAGTDPPTWWPCIPEIASMQAADLILLNGAELYGWTQRVSLPQARVVDTVCDSRRSSLIQVKGPTHGHGDEPEHSHAAVASNTSLDLQLAGLQAAEVAAAIVRINSEEADAVARQLAALGAKTAWVAAALASEPLIAPHGGYEYPARALGAEITALSWDVEVPPDAAALADLNKALARCPARLMLFSAPLSPEAVAAPAERGIAAVLLDTAATAPSARLSALSSGLDALEGAAQEAAPESRWRPLH